MPKVVTCLLENNGEILILKRSEKVRTYRGLWGGVGGYVEGEEKPLETVIKEIKEEVDIEKDDIILIKQGDSVEFTDIYEGENYDWIIYPFLFYLEKRDGVKIDWEHTEYRWILPSDIEKYDTVPHLKEIVSKIVV